MLQDLISEINDLMGWECPILIDQEGGRVQRLTGPDFLNYPPVNLFGKIANQNLNDAKKAVQLNYSLIGKELRDIGINVNCAPCLDVLSIDTHDVIGDRAFSNDPILVTILGDYACKGLISQGVVPVIKHIPGHGRSNMDSHKELPIVKDSLSILQKSDFLPFKQLSNMPLAMTAHIIYKEIDDSCPISISRKAYEYIRNRIKYEGILMTDDINMKALSGSIKDKINSITSAGYDLILHCSGEESEIEEVLEFSPYIKQNILDKWLKVFNELSINEFGEKKDIIADINKILSSNIGINWKFI